MPMLDATHDPARRSWVASAQAPGTDFPIQNLPFGVFRTKDGEARGGVAIGDQILDLQAALDAGMLSGLAAEAAAAGRLNGLMALGRGASAALRTAISDLLWVHAPPCPALLVPMAEAEMLLPCDVRNFSDFMASIDHCERLGRARDPNNPLPPAFRHLPVAYHSRASSVRVSGEGVVRPNGQYPRPDGAVRFGPTDALDFELELGIWIAGENALGTPVTMADAPGRIFGYCLLNDWSARDIQRWEMPPLGPFLAKSVSTSVSPWVITAEALAPFAVPARERAAGEPAVLPHLDSTTHRAEGALALAMQVALLTPAMRAAGTPPARITATEYAGMYWTSAQMVAHHGSNGCNLLAGDLLGSGTCSGPEPGAAACIAEMLLAGPIQLPNGETRRYLQDGDEVIFTARASRDGAVPIGFGECRGVVLPAVAWLAEQG